MFRVGIVDDDEEFASLLAEQLDQDTSVTDDPGEALGWVKDDRVDCLFTDLKMGKMSGLDLLDEVQSVNDGFPVVLMTGHGSIDTAVEAMKKGAVDYIQKPVEGREAEALVERLSRQVKNEQRLEGFRESQRSRGETEYQLVGQSDRIARLREKIEQLAPQPMSVLIKGETGTGKEIVARQLHEKSNRSEAPIMTVNCAAIPGNLLEEELFGHKKGAFTGADETKKGKLELADGGTVFLDEIGELPLELQPKLLRVLEHGEVTKVGGEFPRTVDVRFLAATNRNIGKMLEEDSFRKDLYYRLNSLEIDAPPLREHPEDIPELVEHFLGKMAGRLNEIPRMTDEALERLRAYDWPGNVRELRNVVERTAVLVKDQQISVDDLPEEITRRSPSPDRTGFNWKNFGDNLQDAMDNLELEIIETVVDEVDGNKAEAARRLGISRQSLQYKLNRED